MRVFPKPTAKWNIQGLGKLGKRRLLVGKRKEQLGNSGWGWRVLWGAEMSYPMQITLWASTSKDITLWRLASHQTRCNILEDLNPHKYHCDNATSCVSWCLLRVGVKLGQCTKDVWEQNVEEGNCGHAWEEERKWGWGWLGNVQEHTCILHQLLLGRTNQRRCICRALEGGGFG
jgi:hypothetical protein